MVTTTYAFANTFYFFSMHQASAAKNKKSLQATAPDNADICANLTRHRNGPTEARTDNSGFKKLAVRLLNQHLFFVPSSELAFSNIAFVLGGFLLEPKKHDTTNRVGQSLTTNKKTYQNLL